MWLCDPLAQQTPRRNINGILKSAKQSRQRYLRVWASCQSVLNRRVSERSSETNEGVTVAEDVKAAGFSR